MILYRHRLPKVCLFSQPFYILDYMFLTVWLDTLRVPPSLVKGTLRDVFAQPHFVLKQGNSARMKAARLLADAPC